MELDLGDTSFHHEDAAGILTVEMVEATGADDAEITATCHPAFHHRVVVAAHPGTVHQVSHPAYLCSAVSASLATASRCRYDCRGR